MSRRHLCEPAVSRQHLCESGVGVCAPVIQVQDGKVRPRLESWEVLQVPLGELLALKEIESLGWTLNPSTGSLQAWGKPFHLSEP